MKVVLDRSEVELAIDALRKHGGIDEMTVATAIKIVVDSCENDQFELIPKEPR